MAKSKRRMLSLATLVISQSSAFSGPISLAQPRTAVRALHAHTRRDWLVNAGSMGIVAAGVAAPAQAASSPIVYGDESLMAPKAHGTTATAVQGDLLYGVDQRKADQICSFNRRWAEAGGSWESKGLLPALAKAEAVGSLPLTFYDSVTGKPLFKAPIGRSMEDFVAESKVHGWPSFRDQEVVWSNVRILRDGEAVSVDGTHLGHDLPDRTGHRYCINLVSVAGHPV